MSNELPPLTRLIMAAEAIDAQAAVSSRSGQMADLEAEATVLREVHGDLTAELDRLRARVAELEAQTPDVQWGVRLRNGVTTAVSGEREARNALSGTPMCRPVGEWVAAPSVPSGEETP